MTAESEAVPVPVVEVAVKVEYDVVRRVFGMLPTSTTKTRRSAALRLLRLPSKRSFRVRFTHKKM